MDDQELKWLSGPTEGKNVQTVLDCVNKIHAS